MYPQNLVFADIWFMMILIKITEDDGIKKIYIPPVKSENFTICNILEIMWDRMKVAIIR